MIWDAHMHLQSLPGHPWDSPLDRVLRVMDEAGVEKAVIMPYCEISPANRYLLDETIEAVEKSRGRLIGFARMDPKGEEKGLCLFEEALRSRAIQGLKFHPVGSLVHPADPRTVAFVEKAAEWKVPILFHCGDEELTLPWQIGALAEKVPQATIILGHMGGYFHVEEAIQVAEKYPNCYLETSATPNPFWIQKALERVGAERILFGSDGPGCLPLLEVKKIRLLELPQEVEKKIFRENLKSLLEEKKW